jgi:two-component system nitrate/nitrite sensor histidine kinase NarX
VEAAETARREEQERRQEAERRRRIAESLAGALTVLNSNRSLDDVLDYITVQVRQLFGTRAAAIYSLEGDTGGLSVQSTQGLLLTYVAGVEIPIGQQALRQAMATRQPVAVPDLAATYADPALAYESGGREMLASWIRFYRALLAVPVIVGGQVYGGMLLYYARPRDFSPEEIALAASFSNQVALAVGNARLQEDVKRTAMFVERDRLARELHDAVTQTLFSASLIAEAIPHVWERNQQEGRRGLEEIRLLTRGAAAEMRAMLLELRPATLTEKPLGELLRHLTEAITSRTRVPIKLEAEGGILLPPDVQIAFYRIAQEALNNVAKHANARQATVSLLSATGQATLRVCDDGSGFEASDVLPDRMGLGIMRERAEGIGASYRIESSPGHGTEISVRWQTAGRV